jgi:hypothetical protein
MIGFYLLLIALTSGIGYLLYLIIKRTQEWSFAIGIFFLYYWSLLGSWFFVFDDYTHGGGIKFGLHYHYLFQKLFKVQANVDYAWVIFGYGLFIIIIQLMILGFAKPKDKLMKILPEKIKINHFLLIGFCICCSILSLALVWEQILIAAKYGESVYFVTRSYTKSTYTIHQLLNQVSIVALYLGLVTYLCGEKGKYFTAVKDKKVMIGYILAVLIVEGGLLFLGNKREILFAGIFGFIYYLNSMEYKINWRPVSLFFVIVGFPLFFNDALRGISPAFLTNYFDVSELYFTPPEVEYTSFSVSGAATTFLFSNEMFAGHFSLYGAIHQDIPYTYGTSIKSLVASGIPRFIYPNRPEGIYEYYITQVGGSRKGGFTIHHATGWFLNFGWIGLMMGAALLGGIWAYFYNSFHEVYKFKRQVFRLFFTLALGCFVAFLPSMIRTGPEGYKALLFEALLLPCLIVIFSTDTIKWRRK